MQNETQDLNQVALMRKDPRWVAAVEAWDDDAMDALEEEYGVTEDHN